MASQRLRIEGDMTVYRAPELKATLLAALGGGDACELDLSAVADIDSAGVQLLALAQQAAKREGVALSIGAISQPVAQALALFDLAAHFGAALAPAALEQVQQWQREAR
ncbi:MAG TPA: STAS domain-containing protein [Burkholderiaceae bacterium]